MRRIYAGIAHIVDCTRQNKRLLIVYASVFVPVVALTIIFADTTQDTLYGLPVVHSVVECCVGSFFALFWTLAKNSFASCLLILLIVQMRQLVRVAGMIYTIIRAMLFGLVMEFCIVLFGITSVVYILVLFLPYNTLIILTMFVVICGYNVGRCNLKETLRLGLCLMTLFILVSLALSIVVFLFIRPLIAL